MSLIFQTLRKLEGDTGRKRSSDEVDTPLPAKRRRRLGIGPVPRIAAILGFCVLFGLGAIYGVRHVVDRVAPSPVTTERSVPRRSEALAAPAAEPANPQAAEPVRQVQYYAPQPAVKADSSPEHSETVATMTVVPAPAPERAGVKEIVAESPPGKRKSPPTDGETNERRGAASQPSPKEFERLQAARNFSVALEKQSRIQHLVEATQAALTHEPVDPERIEKLLDEVAQVKGADHPFVLKLRGYWLIKQERWESASELLTRVTAREPEDLEAGVNLAMIEMRRDDRDAALVRLSRLRQTYPDNAQVCDLLRRLQ